MSSSEASSYCPEPSSSSPSSEPPRPGLDPTTLPGSSEHRSPAVSSSPPARLEVSDSYEPSSLASSYDLPAPPLFPKLSDIQHMDDTIIESKATVIALKRELTAIFNDSGLSESNKKRARVMAQYINSLEDNNNKLQSRLVASLSASHTLGLGPSALSDHDIATLEEDDDPPEYVIARHESLVQPPVPSQVTMTTVEKVKTYDEVFNKVFGAIKEVHDTRPDHPMFGDVGLHLVRCPLGPSGPNAASWHSKIQSLARRLKNAMGDEMVPGSCWMTKNSAILWQKKNRHEDGRVSTDRYSEVAVVRLLCFLQDPTDEAWGWLTNEKYGVSGGFARASPFCHLCHNGQASRKKEDLFCVNGFEHGFFGTASTNNLMKTCAGNQTGRWQCSGHDDLKGKKRHCVYVNKASGALQPCRNKLTYVLPDSCQCVPDCWTA